jgi:quaternary ammonium compound-resistance protein SugE
MAGLAYAMRELPIGTSYVVWVGIGASLTAGYAMVTGSEPVSLVRILLLLGIVGCVVGLKLVGDAPPDGGSGTPGAPASLDGIEAPDGRGE